MALIFEPAGRLGLELFTAKPRLTESAHHRTPFRRVSCATVILKKWHFVILIVKSFSNSFSEENLTERFSFSHVFI